MYIRCLLVALILLTGITPPAQAETGKWFDQAGIGWFPHWGLGTGRPADRVEGSAYVYRNAEEFEAASRDWSAARMVDVARRMHASYITISTLHSRLGYVRVWPSSIPGTVATRRDYLGELIAEATKHRIKVVVYVTGDPLWWNDNRDNQQAPPPAWLPYGATGWLDVAAYRAYKNDPAIDIRKRVDWKRHFARDTVDEIITRYPNVGGFWFDGWGGDPATAEGRAAIELFEHIHARLPGAVNIKNNGGGVTVPGEDVAAMEDCQSCLHRKEPDYDLPSQFPRGPYNYENPFETLGWWYRHSDASVPWTPRQNAFHLKKFITSIGNGWVPNWGIGNTMNGGLPPAGEALVDQMNSFLSWAKPSLVGVRPGGYAEGGFDPGYWNDGAYGVTTMRGRNTHYLHVLTPPSGRQLVVPDGGHDVAFVQDLQTKRPLHFRQSGGKLYVDVPSWDAAVNQAATVLRVHTFGRGRVLSTEGWAPTAATDGDYSTVYKGTRDLTVDMGRSRSLAALRIVQPESSRIAVLNEGEKIQSTRIKDYSLEASSDGVNWTSVSSGQLANQRGSQSITFKSLRARYLRLTAASTHNGANGRIEVTDVKAIAPRWW